MSDMGEKSRTIRGVDDALWEQFSALPGTQSEALRGLLGRSAGEAGPGLVQKIYERQLAIELKLDEILETVQSVPTSSQVPSTFPGAAVGAEKAADFPFHPKCAHCGQNFGAYNRTLAICPGCKGANHYGEPRDCDGCVLRQGGA